MRSSRRARLRQLREKLKERQEPILIRVATWERLKPAHKAQEATQPAEASPGSSEVENSAPDAAEARWHRCGGCGHLVRCEAVR